MSSRSLYESIPCLNGLSVSLGNSDNVFSVDADTGNLTMNKVATSANSYLLQVMVSMMTLQQKSSIAGFLGSRDLVVSGIDHINNES